MRFANGQRVADGTYAAYAAVGVDVAGALVGEDVGTVVGPVVAIGEAVDFGAGGSVAVFVGVGAEIVGDDQNHAVGGLPGDWRLRAA